MKGNRTEQREDARPARPAARRTRKPTEEREHDRLRVELGDHVELGRLLLDRLQRDGDLVFDEGRLYSYDQKTGLWQGIEPALEQRIVLSFSGAEVDCDDKPLRLKASDVNGVITCAHKLAARPGHFNDPRHGLPFANVFIESGERGIQILSHSPEHRARAGYPFTYDPNASVHRWVEFLDDVFKPDEDKAHKIALIQEFAGACMLGIAPRYQTALVALGAGANGKSVLITALAAVMPKGTTAAVAPQEWDNDYKRAMLAGKHFNAVSELPERDIIDSERFKAIVSGDEIVGRPIREKPFSFKPIAGHLFAANRLPGTPDLTDGFWRRLIVLSFNRTFALEEQHAGLAELIIREELQGIVAWSLEGAHRLLQQGGYTIPPSHHAVVGEWRKSVNNVAVFCEAKTREAQSPSEGTYGSPLYESYRNWASANGYKPVNSRHFKGRMTALGYPPRHTNKGELYPVTVLMAAGA